MKNQYEMRRTRELRVRFERLRREVEALEALPDVSGELEPVDPIVFAEICAALDGRGELQRQASVAPARPVPSWLRG